MRLPGQPWKPLSATEDRRRIIHYTSIGDAICREARRRAMSVGSNFIVGGSDGLGIQQLGSMSNRHGMIAGATGTGKTVTLQIL
ncbi:MAG: helicase HerA-like domain-containing protein, partial [Sedimenticola sp.]